MRFIAFGALLSTAAAAGGCEPWCADVPCGELNGNIEVECGGCTSTSACWPGADDYGTWQERSGQHKANKAKRQDAPPTEKSPQQAPDPPEEDDEDEGYGDNPLADHVAAGGELPTKDDGAGAGADADADADEADDGTRTEVDFWEHGQKRLRSGYKVQQGCDDAECVDAQKTELLAYSHDMDAAIGGASISSGEAMRVAADAARAAMAANNVSVPCQFQRVTKGELYAMSEPERKRYLTQPTIVSGLNDDWPAFARWASPANLSARYGEHNVMAKRSSFSYGAADRMGIDVNRAGVKFKSVVNHAISEHIIVLDDETGSEGEQVLLRSLSADYSVPRLLESASLLRVFSFGGGSRGVEMMQHDVAWLAVVAGAKLWQVADKKRKQPSSPLCDEQGTINYKRCKREGVRVCLALPGEVMIVPSMWWHATCNMLPYTVGIGGQVGQGGLSEWADHDPPKKPSSKKQPELSEDPQWLWKMGWADDGLRNLNKFQRNIWKSVPKETMLPQDEDGEFIMRGQGGGGGGGTDRTGWAARVKELRGSVATVAVGPGAAAKLGDALKDEV